MIAETESGNFLDQGVRVNSAFGSYRIVDTDFSRKFGDISGSSFPDRDSLTLEVEGVGTVNVPYVAGYTGAPFTDSASLYVRVPSSHFGYAPLSYNLLRLLTRNPYPALIIIAGQLIALLLLPRTVLISSLLPMFKAGIPLPPTSQYPLTNVSHERRSLIPLRKMLSVYLARFCLLCHFNLVARA